MGTYEEICVTIRPDEESTADVERELERFLECPRDDLPALSDRLASYFAESDRYDDYQRDRLSIATDDRQVYLGGKTHTHGDYWCDLITKAGIGDGLLAIVHHHETDHVGFVDVYEWDEGAGRYRDVSDDLTADCRGTPRRGVPLAMGAVVARRVAAQWDIEPARFTTLSQRRFVTMDDEEFLPESYGRRGQENEE